MTFDFSAQMLRFHCALETTQVGPCGLLNIFLLRIRLCALFSELRCVIVDTVMTLDPPSFLPSCVRRRK